jgi:hypothetical protein
MSGTGVFKSKLILDATKKLALKTMNRELNKVLSQASTQEVLEQGLIKWAQFSTAKVIEKIVPDSIQFFQTTDLSGLSYQVQD